MIVSRVLLALLTALKITRNCNFIPFMIFYRNWIVWLKWITVGCVKGWTRTVPYMSTNDPDPQVIPDRNERQIVLYINWFRTGNGRLLINERNVYGLRNLDDGDRYFFLFLWNTLIWFWKVNCVLNQSQYIKLKTCEKTAKPLITAAVFRLVFSRLIAR